MTGDCETASYKRHKRERLRNLLGRMDSSSDGSRDTSTSGSSGDSVSASRLLRKSIPKYFPKSLSFSKREKQRHHSNPLCDCSNCGTSYPFRPARGRSFIIDDTKSNDSGNTRKTVSFCLPPNTLDLSSGRNPLLERRLSTPDPFPELVVSFIREDPRSPRCSSPRKDAVPSGDDTPFFPMRFRQKSRSSSSTPPSSPTRPTFTIGLSGPETLPEDREEDEPADDVFLPPTKNAKGDNFELTPLTSHGEEVSLSDSHPGPQLL